MPSDKLEVVELSSSHSRHTLRFDTVFLFLSLYEQPSHPVGGHSNKGEREIGDNDESMIEKREKKQEQNKY